MKRGFETVSKDTLSSLCQALPLRIRPSERNGNTQQNVHSLAQGCYAGRHRRRREVVLHHLQLGTSIIVRPVTLVS